MNYLKASEARQITQGANTFRHIGAQLKTLLGNVSERAAFGESYYISQGWGSAVDFPALMVAMRDLGYNVEDYSNKPTGTGGTYMNRTLKVSW
jgi:hypothetical protein